MRKYYGIPTEEKGHKTTGHACLTTEDQIRAAEVRSDLLYGEVLPEGVSRMFDSDHLNLAKARTFVDLGAGLGKLAIQAFLQFPNLNFVTGVELARSRVRKGIEAVKRLERYNYSTYAEEDSDGDEICLVEERFKRKSIHTGEFPDRELRLRVGDLFKEWRASSADVVVCETKFPEEKISRTLFILGKFQA